MVRITPSFLQTADPQQPREKKNEDADFTLPLRSIGIVLFGLFLAVRFARHEAPFGPRVVVEYKTHGNDSVKRKC